MKTRSFATASCGVQRHVVSDSHRRNRRRLADFPHTNGSTKSTCSKPDARLDTIYKATNWTCACDTAGFTQNLALRGNVLLAIIPFDDKRNLLSLIVEYQDDKT